ncbi:MAG: hypothetical protein ACREHF_03680 [Rhizomicrobium sp.]
MPRIINKPGFTFAPAAIVSAALALGVVFAQAPAAAKGIVTPGAKEVTLATPDQALAYCQSGKMPGGDIAYINGPAGMSQYGPDSNCVQQVPTKTAVKKAVRVVGNRVSECKLESPRKALLFCQSGAMGEWDIDYVSGKVGKTISGPGYGCVVNYTTSSVGNAVCK